MIPSFILFRGKLIKSKMIHVEGVEFKFG